MKLTDIEKTETKRLLEKYYDALDDSGIAFLIGTAKMLYEQRFLNSDADYVAAAESVRDILAENQNAKILHFPKMYLKEGV